MNLVPEFTSLKVLCVGDLMLDRYARGSVQRISPESPVPVFLLGDQEAVPGGAANVARNIAALGGFCTLVGAVGDDFAGRELLDLLVSTGRINPQLVTDRSRPTVEKTRFVAHGQQLLRADRETSGDIGAGAARDVIGMVKKVVEGHDVVILSDYAKGLLTDAVISAIIGVARELKIPVVVDPKSSDLRRYRGASLLTPNAKETAAAGFVVVDDASAEHAGKAIIEHSQIGAVLITRAERGMSLIGSDGSAVHIPATAREVFDVSGAGDTVIAVVAACMGVKVPIEDAARLANAAAGLVVAKHGTATVTRSELIAELANRARAEGASTRGRVLSAPDAGRQAEAWRGAGLSVGFTNGCFDIMHVGHVQILEYARAHCDRLIVGLNTDTSTSRLKGPLRPINTEQDRARLLGALNVVDAVVLFDDDTPASLIEALQPDVLVKGADYTTDQIAGAQTVLARGGKVLLCELVPGRSTTNLIARSSTVDGSRRPRSPTRSRPRPGGLDIEAAYATSGKNADL